MSDTSLRKYIELFKPDIFGHIHIELYRRQSLWRIIQCGIIRKRSVRNQNTRSVYRSLVRKICHLIVNRQDSIGYFILIEHIFGFTNQTVYLIFGQSIYFTQLTNNRTVTKRTHSPHQSGMFTLIPSKNIVVHFIPISPRKIYIKVGWAFSFRI